MLEADGANASARDIRSNQLRIGAAHHTAAIPERNALIDDFMIAAPDVPLRVLRRSPLQLHEDLARGDVDVAILLEIDREEDAAATGPPSSDDQRWIIGRRRLRLWVPPGHPFAAGGSLDAAALRGQEVGAIDRSHGVLLAEAVGRALHDAGALPISLPEGDAQSVARQCRRLGKCAVDLGWFAAGATDMASVAVIGWTPSIALVVKGSPANRRDGARRFLASLG